jgi:hypothetical protein
MRSNVQEIKHNVDKLRRKISRLFRLNIKEIKPGVAKVRFYILEIRQAITKIRLTVLDVTPDIGYDIL